MECFPVGYLFSEFLQLIIVLRASIFDTLGVVANNRNKNENNHSTNSPCYDLLYLFSLSCLAKKER